MQVKINPEMQKDLKMLVWIFVAMVVVVVLVRVL